MISYIKGQLTEIFEDRIVVENQDIGYNISVPGSLLEELPGLGSQVKIYTYFYVREDAVNLYGFFSRQDQAMFQQLLGVSGIGPKGALGILSVMRPDMLRMAILAGDAKAISKAPGIGNKTAQRVILDLKDRIHPEDILEQGFTEAVSAGVGLMDSGKEAVEALVALGYSAAEASRAVKRVEITEDTTTEEVLKGSLKYLSF